MRTAWHGWAVGAVLAVAAAVGAGWASEPAAAKPAEPTANIGRLLLMGRDEENRHDAYVWVDPDGGRPTRLTVNEARAAGADLYEMIYLDGIIPRRATSAFPSGAVRPNGDVPLSTRKGMVLLTPGDPPAVRPLAAVPLRQIDLVGWSADGRRCVTRGHDADDNTVHALLDTATGDSTPLSVPAGWLVSGWCEAGGWLLATPGDERNVLDRLTSDAPHRGRYVRLSLDGGPVEEVPGGPLVEPVLSPDGRRVVHAKPATVDGQAGRTLELVDPVDGARRAVGFWPAATSLRVCWAPDGRRLAVQELFGPPLGRRTCGKTWVCDLAGNRAEVPAVGTLIAWR